MAISRSPVSGFAGILGLVDFDHARLRVVITNLAAKNFRGAGSRVEGQNEDVQVIRIPFTKLL